MQSHELDDVGEQDCIEKIPEKTRGIRSNGRRGNMGDGERSLAVRSYATSDFMNLSEGKGGPSCGTFHFTTLVGVRHRYPYPLRSEFHQNRTPTAWPSRERREHSVRGLGRYTCVLLRIWDRNCSVRSRAMLSVWTSTERKKRTIFPVAVP